MIFSRVLLSQKRVSRFMALCALGLAVLTMGPLAWSAPMAVNNHSFESASYTGANSWTNNLEDTDANTTIEWVGRDGSSSGLAFIERIGNFASQGAAHIGMESGYYIFQNTDVPWAPNTRYTLTVGVGNRNTGFTVAGNRSVIGLTDAVPAYATAAEAVANDPQLSVSNTAVNASTWPVSTFRDQTVIFDTGDTAPGGTVVIFAGSAGASRAHFDNFRLDFVELADQDGDGLPSSWETTNGLNPNSAVGDNGAAGDPDGDASTNLQEFQRSTLPKNGDTDGDGAKDGWETLTGIFVSGTDLGTDPLRRDTDGDTLADGAEVVAAKATDPNKADTDGDQFEDQAELAAGTNPSVGGQGSVPVATGDLLLGLNFVGGRVDGTLGAVPSGPAGVVPQSNWNNLPDLSGAGVALVDGSNVAALMRASWTVDDVYTIETPSAPVDANSELMQGFLRSRQGVLTQVVVRNIPYPAYDVYVYADGDATNTMATYTVNGVAVTRVRDAANWPVSTGGGVFKQVTGNDTDGNYMVFRGVTGPTVTLTATDTTAGGGFGAPINAVQIIRATGDTDGDGMPDIWEESNGLNKNLNDAALDGDADASANLQEYQRGTDPRMADTDGDGVRDGSETKTGTFVSGTNTGSDPLKADTDGDGLSDGVEDGTGTFVDASRTGSNPNRADTDGDGFPDGEEVTFGTSPVSAASQPVFPAPTGYWSFDDRGDTFTADLSGAGHAGFLQGGVTYVAGHSGKPSDFAVQLNGSNAAVTTEVPLLDGKDAYTMTGWVNFTATQRDRTGFFGLNDAIEFGMNTATSIELWSPTGGAIQTPFGPSSNGWRHIAVVADATGRRIYIDGALVASGPVGTPTASPGFNFNMGGGGVQDAAGNFLNGLLDDVAVWDQALPASIIPRLAARTLTPLGGGVALDTDRDGMPDVWEDANGFDKNLNDAALDADSDGLTNLQEYQNSTNPRAADSDGDTIRDGAETNTGVFVSGSNTGTNPLKTDTDNDGLADGVENGTGAYVDGTSTGSNPNRLDTDGDGFPDGEEVLFQSNPVVASSRPVFPAPAGYWSFDDQGASVTADLSGSGHDGTLQGGVVYGPGHSGRAGDFAVQLNGTDAAVTTAVPLLDGLDGFTLAGWVNFTEPQAPRTGFFGQNDVVEFGMNAADSIELWTPTGGAIQTPFGPSSNGWRHITVIADAVSRRLFVDGVLVASGAVGTPTSTAGFNFNMGGAGIQDGAGNFLNGQLDDVAVWTEAIPTTFISQLAAGTLTPAGGGGTDTSFAISNVVFNKATQQVVLTFPTVVGARYAVFERNGAGVAGAWAEVTSFVATGETGTHTSTIPASVTTRLFRVSRVAN
jgi:hypothetical protein